MSQTSIMLKLRTSIVKNKKSSIFIQFIKDRKVMAVTTPYKIYQEEWDAKRSMICFDESEPNRQKYLSEISISLMKELEELKIRAKNMEDTRNCTLEEIVELYGGQNRFRMLSTYVQKLRKELKDNFQERTSEAYQTVINNVVRFNSGNDLSLDRIDAFFVKKFEIYMKKRDNSLNTISFYMRNLRAIYNKAVRERIIERKNENPFDGVYTSVCKTRKRAARKEIFISLENLDLQSCQELECEKRSYPLSDEKKKSLDFARDMFFLSFYLRGISFIDLAYLKKSDVSKGIISYVRRKTKQKLEIAMTPEIEKIINRYTKMNANSDYLLPILQYGDSRNKFLQSLRRQNNNLKILSQMMGLEQALTTYVARHSWASIAWSRGYSISMISLGLGHDSEKTTKIYMDSLDYSNLHEANKKIISFTHRAS